MKNAIAGRYAKTLFRSIQDDSILELVEKDMKLIEDIFDRNIEVNVFLSDIKIKSKQKLDILLKALDCISDTSKNFLEFLESKNRISLIKDVALEFSQIICEINNVKKATIYSSVLLNSTQIKAIAEKLSENTKLKYELVCVVDKSLIGGFLVKIDDKIIDSSIKNKLNILRDKLSA